MDAAAGLPGGVRFGSSPGRRGTVGRADPGTPTGGLAPSEIAETDPPSRRPMPPPFDPHRHWLGIGPEERPVDHYRLLGLPRFEDDRAVIGAALVRSLRQVGGSPEPGRDAARDALVAELQRAAETLLRHDSRAAYDARLRGDGTFDDRETPRSDAKGGGEDGSGPTPPPVEAEWVAAVDPPADGPAWRPEAERPPPPDRPPDDGTLPRLVAAAMLVAAALVTVGLAAGLLASLGDRGPEPPPAVPAPDQPGTPRAAVSGA